MNRTTIRIAALFAAVTLAGTAAAQTVSFLSPAPLTDAGWMPHPAVKKASRLAVETPAPLPAVAPAPLPALQERAEPSGPAFSREATVLGEMMGIGDLVDHVGAVADVAIFRAPDLGQTGIVPAASVRDAVRPHHIIALVTRGLVAFQVTRASRA